MAQKQSGFPRNLGDPDRLHGKHAALGRSPHHKYSRSTVAASCTVGAKPKTHRVVPPSEGNEVRREGRQEVVAP
jgi:hypothetical protein